MFIIVILSCSSIDENSEKTDISDFVFFSLTVYPITHILYKGNIFDESEEKYEKYVFDNIAKRWGRMLYCGATAFWKTDGGAEDFGCAGSLCHGWSAFPLCMYYRYVLGVTSESINGEGEFDVRKTLAEYSGRVKNDKVEITVEKTEGNKSEYAVHKV